MALVNAALFELFFMETTFQILRDSQSDDHPTPDHEIAFHKVELLGYVTGQRIMERHKILEFSDIDV